MTFHNNSCRLGCFLGKLLGKPLVLCLFVFLPFYLYIINKEFQNMNYTKHNIKTSLATIKGKCYVRIRVSCLGKRLDLHTGISVVEEKWNFSKGRVKQGAVINREQYNVLNSTLDEMEHFVDDYFTSCALRNSDPNLVELKERFSKKYIKPNKSDSEEFFYLFSQYIETTGKTRKWGESIKKYFFTTHKEVEGL